MYILLSVRIYHMIIISRQSKNYVNEGRFSFVFMTLMCVINIVLKLNGTNKIKR